MRLSSSEIDSKPSDNPDFKYLQVSLCCGGTRSPPMLAYEKSSNYPLYSNDYELFVKYRAYEEWGSWLNADHVRLDRKNKGYNSLYKSYCIIITSIIKYS